MIYLISRHSGASEWAKRQGFEATVVAHADDAFWQTLKACDVCIGTLPMHLAFDACIITGNPFGFFSIDVKPEMRGLELSADQMEECNASIRWFEVQQADGWDVSGALNNQ